MPVHFMRPEWLWLLVPAVIVALLLWQQRGQRGSWQTVIAPELLQHLVGESSGSRSFNFLPVILLGWIMAAVAASGPSWQKIPQPIHQKQDALVILLDLSYSMKSGDLSPSRQDRARQKLLDLLKIRREGQTGLIAYAGDAHIVTPLTDDILTIANLLPALHPDMMPVPGSNPASAVAQGLDLLHSAGIAEGRLLLVTDEVTASDNSEIARLLRRSAAQLSIMGVGTGTGAPIPLTRGGFLKDGSGDIVMPGLQESSLRDLASKTSGRYRRMQVDDGDLNYLLAENPLATSEQTLALNRTADTWEDQGYLFVLPLLVLVLGLFRRGWLPCLLPIVLAAGIGMQPQSAQALGWDDLWLTPDQQGQRALQAGDAEGAAELFEDSRWAGTAAYRGEDYETSSEYFSQDDSADGWYNRGNALIREGKLDDAIDAYKESLALQPDQDDAEENLKLAEDLKEQQEEQEQQQQENQEQDQEEGEGEEDQEEKEQQEGDSQQGDQQQDQEGSPQEGEQEGEQEDNSESSQEPGEQGEPQESEEQAAEQQAQAGLEEGDEGDEEQQPQLAPANPEELERDQAMEQWLRRVPDDPSGLLREKFRYESQQRQKEGNQRQDEKVW